MFELTNPGYQKNNVTINRDQLEAILKTLDSSQAIVIQQVSLGIVGVIVEDEPVEFNRHVLANHLNK